MPDVAWVLLVVAGLLEVVWAVALKLSDGFSRPLPSVVGVAAAAASFMFLSLALRSLPVGTAYATWVGIGAFGVGLVGMVAFDEGASPARLALLTLVVVGVIGLTMLEGTSS